MGLENNSEEIYNNNYVVIFLFDVNLEHVWLIEKQKPEWQRGLLNGIGGKIEKDELPINAAIRELKEESGITLTYSELINIGSIISDSKSFIVHVYTGITDKVLISQEQESIHLIKLNELRNYPMIDNIPILVEASITKILTPYYKEFILKY